MSEVADTPRIRASEVARLTSLSLRKVQELAVAGKIDGAAKLSDGDWDFDIDDIRKWIRREEDVVRKQGAILKRQERDAKISKLMLLKADEILANAIPAKIPASGIYFLINRGKIVYVGQSRNMAARLLNHVEGKIFDHWFWVPCSIPNLDVTERAYINALLPRLNKDWETKHARRNNV